MFRILQGLYRPKFSLQERKRLDKRVLVFISRLVDDRWTPGFISELVNAEFLCALTDDDSLRLSQFLADNPDVVNEFEKFRPPEIDLLLNFRLNIPASIAKDDLVRMVDAAFAGIGDRGLSNDEILQRIDASALAAYVLSGFANATLQFRCKGYEIQNCECVFRDAQAIIM